MILNSHIKGMLVCICRPSQCFGSSGLCLRSTRDLAHWRGLTVVKRDIVIHLKEGRASKIKNRKRPAKNLEEMKNPKKISHKKIQGLFLKTFSSFVFQPCKKILNVKNWIGKIGPLRHCWVFNGLKQKIQLQRQSIIPLRAKISVKWNLLSLPVSLQATEK